MPPGPESYKVTYFDWFTADTPLTARLLLTAQTLDDAGEQVVVRLTRQAAFDGQELAERSVELRHTLTEEWEALAVSLPSTTVVSTTMLSSLLIANPSSSSSVRVCASHVAVSPAGTGPDAHFTSPKDWLFSSPVTTPSRWFMLAGLSIFLALGVILAGSLGNVLLRVPHSAITVLVLLILALLAASVAIEFLTSPGSLGQRLQGLTGHPNTMAASSVVLFMAIWSWSARRPIVLIALALSFVLVLASGSRAGLVTLTTAGLGLLLLVPLYRNGKHVVATMLATVGVLAAVLTTFLAVDRLQTLTVTRSQIWSASLGAMAERPLGWGYGMAGPVLTSELGPESGRTVGHAHNLFLNIGIEFGIPAFVALVISAALLTAWLLRRRYYAGLVALVVVVLLCVVDVTLTNPWVYGPLILAAISPRFLAKHDKSNAGTGNVTYGD